MKVKKRMDWLIQKLKWKRWGHHQIVNMFECMQLLQFKRIMKKKILQDDIEGEEEFLLYRIVQFLPLWLLRDGRFEKEMVFSSLGYTYSEIKLVYHYAS